MRTYASAKPKASPSLSAPPRSTQSTLLQRKCDGEPPQGLPGQCGHAGDEELFPQRSLSGQTAPQQELRDTREPPAPPEHSPEAGAHKTRGAPAGHRFDRVSVYHRTPGVIQTKLTVGRAGDEYEREADRIAESVAQGMESQDSPRQSAHATRWPLPVNSLSTQPRETLSRQSLEGELEDADEEEKEEEEEEEGGAVQKKSAAGGTPPAPPDLEARINSLRGGGRPLPTPIRAAYETHFGHDFGDVRIHTDSAAAQMSRSLNALAFTTGRDIFFGSSQYDPASARGRRLLAHELTHTVQQNGPRALAGRRAADDEDRGDGGPSPVQVQRQAGPSIQRNDGEGGAAPAQTPSTAPAAQPRATTVSIPWRGSIRVSLVEYVRLLPNTSQAQAERIAEVLLQNITIHTLADGSQVSRAEFESRNRSHFVLTEPLTNLLLRETGLTLPQLQSAASTAELTGTLIDALNSTPIPGESREQQERQAGAVTPVNANWRIMDGNEPLSRAYLRLMEHYVGLALTAEVNARAQGGLTEQELNEIVGRSARFRHFTNLFTQGFPEFQQAGGSDLDAFTVLEERIFEQTAWGNPTATRNQLRIGMGWPEEGILGIAERGSGVLLYDAQAVPLPSFSGMMYRDHGYVGVQPSDTFALNIANISDPALRLMLDMLRQNIGEPTRMVARAAEVYFENIELVNARVQEGLTEEVRRKFVDSLPVFIGFLAGHGASTLLLRSPNPIAIAIGGALRALLLGAGYVLQVDFAGTALQRLLEAATFLSRVRRIEGNRLTELSQYYLDRAAEPIRSMVTDLAMTAVTIGMTRIIGSTITCTRCRFSRRERRTRAREQRRRGEGQQLGFTREAIDAMRRAIIRRPRVQSISGQGHRGATGHGVPDPIIINTVNNPQFVLVARNGNWVFFRNGTIVVTPQGNPSFINTAFGRGARVPQRRLADLRALHPELDLQIGSPEPPVNLNVWMSQQSGPFSVFRIWP